MLKKKYLGNIQIKRKILLKIHLTMNLKIKTYFFNEKVNLTLMHDARTLLCSSITEEQKHQTSARLNSARCTIFSGLGKQALSLIKVTFYVLFINWMVIMRNSASEASLGGAPKNRLTKVTRKPIHHSIRRTPCEDTATVYLKQ